VNYGLGAYVIPRGNIVKMDFETKYKNKKRTLSASNIQLMVGPGVIAYIQQYDDRSKTGYGFCLDKFENKKLVSHMTASTIRYDSISESRNHWKAMNYKIRTLKGLREEIKSGAQIDTMILMEPMDLVFSAGQQETLTSPELRQYISKQIERGSGNVVQYEVEYHKRIATSFASFILTVIGASLSSRKRKGGMGMYLGIGLALSFAYILLQTISATFAIQADTPPLLAVWIPNILYFIIAYFCYRQAPN
jgi:lipopolysaccharide export system permease protein